MYLVNNSRAKELAIKKGFKKEVVKQIPYESENKYSAVFFEENNKNYCTVKGSLEKILEFSSKMKVDGKEIELNKRAIEKQNEGLAKRGYRVIALAEGKVNKKQKYDEK